MSTLGKGRSLVSYATASPAHAADLLWWPAERWSSPLRARRPWWPRSAVRHVQGLVRPGSRILEFGGGGSTLWFLDLGASVTVVEHDEKWAAVLQARVGPNATVILRAPEMAGSVRGSGGGGFFDGYVAVASELEDESFDGVVVDGRARVACMLAALPKLRPGGFLVFDDTHRDRYRAALSDVADWDMRRFEGLKGKATLFETSVLRKP